MFYYGKRLNFLLRGYDIAPLSEPVISCGYAQRNKTCNEGFLKGAKLPDYPVAGGVMYRVLAFVLSVAVLVGLVLFGGFLTSAPVPESRNTAYSDSVVALIARSEQELVDIDVRAGTAVQLALPQRSKALMLQDVRSKALTMQDIENAAGQAGQNAQQTALRVGQSEALALQARHRAERLIQQRLQQAL